MLSVRKKTVRPFDRENRQVRQCRVTKFQVHSTTNSITLIPYREGKCTWNQEQITLVITLRLRTSTFSPFPVNAIPLQSYLCRGKDNERYSNGAQLVYLNSFASFRHYRKTVLYAE